jgi:hypothetical protein
VILGSFDVFMELLYPTADPFSVPQNLLISFLGLKTVQKLCERLEAKVQEGGEERAAEERLELRKSAVTMLYRLALFLGVCLKSMTPAISEILHQINIGEKLTFLFEQIDPKLRVKKLHFVLVKFFIQLAEAKELNVSNLYPGCGFFMLIYKKYRFKNNLINSQFRLQFSSLGLMWTENLVKFAKNNWEYIQCVKDTDECIKKLLTKIVDSSGVLIETRQDFTFSDIPGSPKASIMKLGEVSEFYQMMNSSPDKDKILTNSLSDFEFKYQESDADQMVDLDNFQNRQLELPSPSEISECFQSAPSKLPTISQTASFATEHELLEDMSTFENEEEVEAKETLKGLLASLRKKEQSGDSNEDIKSYLSQDDDGDDYLAPLNTPKQLSFQFMNGPVEDDEDDDVLLPNIRPGFHGRPKSLQLNISLGKRETMEDGELEEEDAILSERGAMSVADAIYPPSKQLKL